MQEKDYTGHPDGKIVRLTSGGLLVVVIGSVLGLMSFGAIVGHLIDEHL